jgi:hypothetical protein
LTVHTVGRHIVRVYFCYIIATVANDPGWFDVERLPTLIAAVVAISIVLYTTYHRSSREKFKVREIPALKAVEEAIGRATEMARPLLYTPGWGETSNDQRPSPP